jgi:ketosteroid isomerase-like protein
MVLQPGELQQNERRNNMKRSFLTMLSVSIITAVLLCGCQSNSKCSQEKRIKRTMTEWKAAMTAEDLEKVMSAYSPNYASERMDDKDAVRKFIVYIFGENWMEYVDVSFEEVATIIEEDKAQFGPVAFISDNGTMKVDYTLQKEGGVWFIVSSKWLQQ